MAYSFVFLNFLTISYTIPHDKYGKITNNVTNIVNIDDYRPHEVSELICLKCFHRWIGVYPEYTLLKDLECKCGEVGYVIKTGQTVV